MRQIGMVMILALSLGAATARGASMTIPAGSTISVRMTDSLDSKNSRAGETFRATLDAPVTIDGKKLRVPSFKSGHALKHSDRDFVDQIVTGGDGMPAFKGKLDPKQINDLVRFIRKEFQHK